MDTILVREEETHERCDCHVCNTLRNLLAARVEAEHDRRSPTPLLLTFGQAAELLGVSEGAVRELVAEQELRAVAVFTKTADDIKIHRPLHGADGLGNDGTLGR